MLYNNSFSDEFSFNPLSNTNKVFSQENDTESMQFNFMNNNTHNSEFQNNLDDLYLQNKEDNKINQIKTEDKKNTTEIEKYKKPEISTIENNANNINNLIVRSTINIINRTLELNENGELELDGIVLFRFLSFLEKKIKKEKAEIMETIDENEDEKILKLPKLISKIDLLTKIKEIKIKEKNEELEDKSEIIYLIEELILFEESENNKEIRKEIKAEAGHNPEPIKKLNITIHKFVINRLIELKNHLMKRYEEINEKIEKKEINFLEKKRLIQEDKKEDIVKDENSISSKEKEDNNNKKIRYRSDNILMMFKRNLIQQIFLDWINEGELNKYEKLSKLDPTIFRKTFTFENKKLKEIYSENISIKSRR